MHPFLIKAISLYLYMLEMCLYFKIIYSRLTDYCCYYLPAIGHLLIYFLFSLQLSLARFGNRLPIY